MKLINITFLSIVLITSFFSLLFFYRKTINYEERRQNLVIIVDSVHSKNINLYTNCVFSEDIKFVYGTGFIYLKSCDKDIFLYDDLQNVRIYVVNKNAGLHNINSIFLKNNLINKITSFDSTGFYSLYKKIKLN